MIEQDIKALAREVANELRKNPPVPREWLSMKEAASYLRVAEQTLSALVKNGKAPPSILISYKARRFRCSELNKWLENGGANV